MAQTIFLITFTVAAKVSVMDRSFTHKSWRAFRHACLRNTSAVQSLYLRIAIHHEVASLSSRFLHPFGFCNMAHTCQLRTRTFRAVDIP